MSDYQRKNFLGYFDVSFLGKAVEGCTKDPRCFIEYKKNMVLRPLLQHPTVTDNSKMKIDLGPRAAEVFKLYLKEAAELKVKRTTDGAYEYLMWNEETGQEEWQPRYLRELMIKYRSQEGEKPSGKYLVVLRGKDGIIKFGVRHYNKAFPFIPFSFTDVNSNVTLYEGNDTLISQAESSASFCRSILALWERFDIFNTFSELPKYREQEEIKAAARRNQQWGAPAQPQAQQPQQGQTSWGAVDADDDF